MLQNNSKHTLLDVGLHLPLLNVVNLSFNKLTSLPDSIAQQLPAVQQIYLANNRLSSLPSSLFSLAIVDMFLSENPLTEVPASLCGMSQLAKLSLAACQLQALPDAIGGLQGLR